MRARWRSARPWDRESGTASISWRSVPEALRAMAVDEDGAPRAGGSALSDGCLAVIGGTFMLASWPDASGARSVAPTPTAGEAERNAPAAAETGRAPGRATPTLTFYRLTPAHRAAAGQPSKPARPRSRQADTTPKPDRGRARAAAAGAGQSAFTIQVALQDRGSPPTWRPARGRGHAVRRPVTRPQRPVPLAGSFATREAASRSRPDRQQR